MYKNETVAVVDIQIFYARPYVNLKTIINKDLMPICLRSNILTIEEWFESRCFSNLYHNYNEIAGWMIGAEKGNISSRIYGYQCTLSLLSYSASLKDKYWLNPVDTYCLNLNYHENNAIDNTVIEPVSSYEQIDFFSKPKVSNEIGKLMLHVEHSDTPKIKAYRTPDFTTSGTVSKKWIIEHNKYCLVKKLYFDQVDFFRKMRCIYIDAIPDNKIIIDEDTGWDLIKSQCVTSKHTEIITAVDLLFSFTSSRIEDDLFVILKKNYISLGYSMSVWSDFEKACKEYLNITGKNQINYHNIAFIKNTVTQNIERFYFLSYL